MIFNTIHPNWFLSYCEPTKYLRIFYLGGSEFIQAIWIITDTGQCIFSHKYIELEIDDQLISGLLIAFDAFSSESGIGGIQQIGGKR